MPYGHPPCQGDNHGGDRHPADPDHYQRLAAASDGENHGGDRHPAKPLRGG